MQDVNKIAAAILGGFVLLGLAVLFGASMICLEMGAEHTEEVRIMAGLNDTIADIIPVASGDMDGDGIDDSMFSHDGKIGYRASNKTDIYLNGGFRADNTTYTSHEGIEDTIGS